MIARRRARALSRVASGSRPAPGTPLKQRAVERALRSDQSGHARGRITRGEALICTTDECHSAKLAASADQSGCFLSGRGGARRGVSVRIAELVAERLLVHSGSNRSGQPMPPTWRCGTRRWCR